VSVPVYQVTANDRVYGNGFFIIKDVKIREEMRDIKGDTTRAYVDISLMEVPEYQVNSGRDQASQVAALAKSILPTGVTGANGGTLGATQSGSKAGADSASVSSSSKNSQTKETRYTDPGGLDRRNFLNPPPATP
jgi:hypothetical protein